MESEYYIKILNENLQLAAQNPDLGQRFTFQQDNDLKHTSQISDCMASEKRWQFCYSLHWALTWIVLKIYGKNWKFE